MFQKFLQKKEKKRKEKKIGSRKRRQEFYFICPSEVGEASEESWKVGGRVGIGREKHKEDSLPWVDRNLQERCNFF